MSAHRITRLPPLSGRDRRHFAREAARAGSAYDEMMRAADVKRAEAARALKAADLIECEAWSGALRFGLDIDGASPTLAHGPSCAPPSNARRAAPREKSASSRDGAKPRWERRPEMTGGTK